MHTPLTGPPNFLRLAWTWVMLPFTAYLISIPFLGAGALFVPIVVMNAPLGLIGYFEAINVQPKPDQQPLIVAIHVGFWVLFFTGVFFRRSLPLKYLWLIWLILVATLTMSISGCAVQIGPGLRNGGNWH